MDKLHKYFGVMLFLFLAMAFVLGILIPSENVKIYETKNKALTEGWKITETNGNNTFVSDFSSKNLRLIRDSSITLVRTVQFPADTKPVIGFYDQGLHVMVYSQERLVYESGKISADVYGEETGSVWRCIPLRGIESGSEIKIFFENNSSGNKYINFSKMFICEENQIYYSILKESTLSIFVYIVCLVVGILLLLFSIAIKDGKLKKYCKGCFSLSLLTFTIGLWVISDCNFFQLIFHSPSVRYGLSYGSFLLLPYCMLLFYMYLVYEDFTVFKITLTVYSVIVFICLLLNLINVIHISKSLIIVHVFLLLEIVLLSFICIKHYIKKKSLRTIVPLILNCLFVSFTIIGGFIYYIFPDRASISTFIGVGYLLFLFIVFVVYGRHIVVILKNE